MAFAASVPRRREGFMKRLLNTLYVTTQDAWLRKDGANVVVSEDGAEIGRVPLHMLGSIVCFGRIGVSTPLMGECANLGIAVSFLTEYGRFLAKVTGPQSGNILLRRAQHDATKDAESSLLVARAGIAAKISNQRNVLARASRDHGKSLNEKDIRKFKSTIRRFEIAIRQALLSVSLDNLRGLEGDSASLYFSCFNVLIRREDPKLQFTGRSRRPPLDAPNAILSFLYVIIMHDCRSALETVGLDPQMGFLHQDRPGRASLALDLLEEFRAPIAERVCLTLLNRKQLGPKDFNFEPNGAVMLKDEARKIVLTALQERKRQVITHPFLEEKIPLGLVPMIQAQLLARYLRGDIDGYPSFFWR
jgi:CRISP-associated protein Cas1